jgi:hypothetical protein
MGEASCRIMPGVRGFGSEKADRNLLGVRWRIVTFWGPLRRGGRMREATERAVSEDFRMIGRVAAETASLS